MASVPSSHRQRTSFFPTPLIGDVLFSQRVVCQTKAVPAYGTAHPDTARWPNHKLVFVKERPEPENQDVYDYFYAADRSSQDDYNWEIGPGEQLVRTYFIPRSTYYQRAVGYTPAVADEFLFPPAGSASPDSRFAHYCFADDTVVEAPEEFRSLYIVIRRRFLRPTTVDIQWDETFERYVRVTKEIIPRTAAAPAVQTDGTRIEIQDGNYFHSVRITTEIILGDSTYPYQIKSIPGVQNVNFPPKLDSVELVWAYAYANDARFAPSYSEQYYHEFDLIDARPGPYEATIERWITDDPEAFQAANPLDTIPNPLRESVGVSSFWFYGGEHGNKTSATAREIALPSSIHDEITIPLNDALAAAPADAGRGRTETLPATPGYADFVAMTDFKLDYRVKQLPLGLFEVSLVTIDITDLYPAPPPP